MGILIDADTRVIVQGITGSQARFDTESCLNYGTKVVAGVTPGKGGETVHGIPVFDTVRRAMQGRRVDASVIYVSASMVKHAVLEAIEAGIKLLVVTAEYVPIHDVIEIVEIARRNGVRLVGCNTNGLISPGIGKLGGAGGPYPDEIYTPGRIGVVSRSGGMMAEIALALSAQGMGVSSSIAMGGDLVTGLNMSDYLMLFDEDKETDAVVLFGEPGTDNEAGVAALVAGGGFRKPAIALIAGEFQERYPAGVSFGHAAAMITDKNKSATAKRRMLTDAGIQVAATLDDIPDMVRRALQ
jgi:succinyl-CoA synthetase alpha subunit